MTTPLQKWLDLITAEHDMGGLERLLADDAVLWSPVVHTPQRGKAIVMAYLYAASQTIANSHFRYVRIFDCGSRAVLEFETQMGELFVNGVDMIEWNEEGLITDFKVMVRPLRAVTMVHQRMGEQLEALKALKAKF
jgi:hypothetical protein